MKLTTVGDEVVRIGLGVEREFRIKATAKAFRILSSGLYKDKIGAILRELSANAYDAHIAAKNAHEPFTVHLPNTMEPYLSIRDFGPGLSHDDVLNIYTTYFESTKTESNDYIGALGLGSKSPFSYVKAFTVVSRNGGYERTYDAFIDESGMPAIALRAESLHGASTGLEVIVPVSSSRDYNEFYQKAQATYAFYPVKPRVTGYNGFRHEEIRYAFEGPGYKIREHGNTYHRQDHKPVAIMGIVGYPIDREALMSASEDEDPRKTAGRQQFWTSENIDSLLQAPIDIEFPVGSLDITAGREELSYEPITVKSLRKRLLEISADLKARVSAEFDACKNEREARQLYEKVFSSGSPVVRALGQRIAVSFRGKAITGANYEIALKDFPNLIIRQYSTGWRGAKELSTTQYDKNAPDYRNRIAIPSTPNVEFRVRDIESTFAQRVHYYQEQNRGKSVYLVECSDQQEFERFQKTMDGFGFQPVSELSKPPPRPKTRAKVKTLNTRYLNQSEPVPSTRNEYCWEASEVTIEDGGYYILTRHANFENPTVPSDEEERSALADSVKMNLTELLSWKSNEVAQIIAAAHHTKLWDFASNPLRAIPVSESKKFLDNDKWVNIHEVLSEKIRDKFENDPQIKDDLAKARAKRTFHEKLQDRTWTTFFGQLYSALQKIDADHQIIQLCDLNRTLNGIPTNMEFYEQMAHNMGVKLGSDIPDEYNLLVKWGKVMSDYPFIKYLLKAQAYGLKIPTTDEFIEYITMVDQRTGA